MKKLLILLLFINIASQANQHVKSDLNARNIYLCARIFSLGEINCSNQLTQLIYNFIQKVEIWESIHKRPMTERDLLNPYLTDNLGGNKSFRPITKFPPTPLSSLEKEKWKILIQTIEEWNHFYQIFLPPYSNMLKLSYYDKLFSFQLQLELKRCKGGCISYTINNVFHGFLAKPFVSDEEWEEYKKITEAELPPIITNRSYISPILRTLDLLGNVSDIPKIQESMGHRLQRWIHREPAPEPIVS